MHVLHDVSDNMNLSTKKCIQMKNAAQSMKQTTSYETEIFLTPTSGIPDEL